MNFYFLPQTEIQQKEELRIRNCVKQQDHNESIPAMDREIFLRFTSLRRLKTMPKCKIRFISTIKSSHKRQISVVDVNFY